MLKRFAKNPELLDAIEEPRKNPASKRWLRVAQRADSGNVDIDSVAAWSAAFFGHDDAGAGEQDGSRGNRVGPQQKRGQSFELAMELGGGDGSGEARRRRRER